MTMAPVAAHAANSPNAWSNRSSEMILPLPMIVTTPAVPSAPPTLRTMLNAALTWPNARAGTPAKAATLSGENVRPKPVENSRTPGRNRVRYAGSGPRRRTNHTVAAMGNSAPHPDQRPRTAAVHDASRDDGPQCGIGRPGGDGQPRAERRVPPHPGQVERPDQPDGQSGHRQEQVGQAHRPHRSDPEDVEIDQWGRVVTAAPDHRADEQRASADAAHHERIRPAPARDLGDREYQSAHPRRAQDRPRVVQPVGGPWPGLDPGQHLGPGHNDRGQQRHAEQVHRPPVDVFHEHGRQRRRHRSPQRTGCGPHRHRRAAPVRGERWQHRSQTGRQHERGRDRLREPGGDQQQGDGRGGGGQRGDQERAGGDEQHLAGTDAVSDTPSEKQERARRRSSIRSGSTTGSPDWSRGSRPRSRGTQCWSR